MPASPLNPRKRAAPAAVAPAPKIAKAASSSRILNPRLIKKHIYTNDKSNKVGKFELIKHAVDIAEKRDDSSLTARSDFYPKTRISTTLGLSPAEFKTFKQAIKTKPNLKDLEAKKEIDVKFPGKRIVHVDRTRPAKTLVTVDKNPETVKANATPFTLRNSYRKNGQVRTPLGHLISHEASKSKAPKTRQTKTLSEWEKHYLSKGKVL